MPIGAEPEVSTAIPGQVETFEERFDRLATGVPTPDVSREVTESSEAFAPPDVSGLPSRGAPTSTFDPSRTGVETPTAERPLPEGMTAADPEESPAKAAIRGTLRTVGSALQLAEVLDPWAPLKRRYGIGVEDNFRRVTDALGVDLSELQAERGTARFAEKLGEEGTAVALTAVPLFRGAKAAQGTALTARRFIGPLLRFPVEQPVAFTATEISAGVGAAGGRAASPEGFGPQVLGAVAGAVPATGLVTLRKLITVPIGNLIKTRTLRTPQAVRVERKAGKRLLALTGGTPESGEEVLGKLERTEELFAGTKGKPSLVQAAPGEPGLKDFELRRAGGDSEFAIGLNKELTRNRAATQESIIEGLNDLAQSNRFEAGEGSLLARAVETDPPTFKAKELIDANLGARAKQAADLMESQIAESQERVATLVSQRLRGGDSSNFSQIMRDELESEADRVFAPFDDVYNDLDATAAAGGARVQNTELTAAYDKLLRQATVAEGTGLPDDIESTLKTLTGRMQRPSRRTVGQGEFIPFAELRGLKRRINAEVKAQRARPEGRTSVKKMLEIKDAANKTLDLSEDGASHIRFVEGTGKARQLVERPVEAERLANTYITNDQSFAVAADRFRKGVTGQILEPQKAPPAATATAGLYIKPGKGKGQREAAESLARASAESPALRAVADDYIVARAWEATNHPEKGPVLANLNRFQRDFKEALDVFPESQRKIRELGSLVEEVEKRQLNKVVSVQAWERSEVGRWLKADNPRAAISSAMKRGPGAVRALLGQVKDPVARRGFADIMWDEIQNQATRYGDLGPGTSLYAEPNAFNKLVDQWAPTIRVVQGQGHVNNLRTLARQAERAFQGKVPESARLQLRSVIEKAKLGWLYNRIYGVGTRLVRGSILGFQWMARRDRGQVHALLDRALVDTQLAADLLRPAISEAAAKASTRRLRGNLLSLGYRVPELEEESP